MEKNTQDNLYAEDAFKKLSVQDHFSQAASGRRPFDTDACLVGIFMINAASWLKSGYSPR